jgi:DNA-directed RNA polymerase specialized sigma24 family protein
MPVKNYLKTDEKQKLQNELKYNEHPDIRERILILLLQNDGKTQQEIADFVGCSLRERLKRVTGSVVRLRQSSQHQTSHPDINECLRSFR